MLSEIIIHLNTYFVNAFTGIQKSYFITFLLQKLKSSSQGLEAILDDLRDQDSGKPRQTNIWNQSKLLILHMLCTDTEVWI